MESQIREFQRDSAPDRSSWQEQIDALRREAAESATLADLARALGRLGEQLRLRPETVHEAVNTLQTAVALVEAADEPMLLTANRLRLAIALQYANRHNDALRGHECVMELIDKHEVGVLRDFALQHLGKCCAEIGRLAEARDCLERALEIRREHDQSDLVQSTLEALDALDGAVRFMVQHHLHRQAMPHLGRVGGITKRHSEQGEGARRELQQLRDFGHLVANPADIADAQAQALGGDGGVLTG